MKLSELKKCIDVSCDHLKYLVNKLTDSSTEMDKIMVRLDIVSELKHILHLINDYSEMQETATEEESE